MIFLIIICDYIEISYNFSLRYYDLMLIKYFTLFFLSFLWDLIDNVLRLRTQLTLHITFFWLF